MTTNAANLDWKTTRLTGITGNPVSVSWTPFNFINFNYSGLCKVLIYFDVVGIAVVEPTPRYISQYCAIIPYEFDPSTNSGAVLIAGIQVITATPGDSMVWSFGHTSGPPAGMVATLSGVASNTWTMFAGARIFAAVVR
jgi:hypothetical protein